MIFHLSKENFSFVKKAANKGKIFNKKISFVKVQVSSKGKTQIKFNCLKTT